MKRGSILIVIAAFFIGVAPAHPAFAAGDRSADLSLIHGSTGLRGKLQWGEVGLKLDFSYPIAPGRTAQATLMLRAEGKASLLLHNTQEVVHGQWPVAETPSPLDLLEPGLGDLRLDTVGEVMLGQLICDVKEGGKGRSVRVWFPTAFPDIPRMARLVTEISASELNLSKVRPTTLKVDDLLVPESYTPLPFDLTDMMIRATDVAEAATPGARMVVWLATRNLEQQMVSVEVDLFLDDSFVVDADDSEALGPAAVIVD